MVSVVVPTKDRAGLLDQTLRSIAEQTYTNIRRWTPMAKGGHFAAMEQPEALAGEIAAFFRSLREATP